MWSGFEPTEADKPIPIFTDLNTLYTNLGDALTHSQRWDHLSSEFQSRFGHPPTYIARAPGRVNLIGEHIDYALFGVLPAAVERDILVACAPRLPPASLSPPVAGSIPETPGVATSEAQDGGMKAQSTGLVTAQNLAPKYKEQKFAPMRRPSLNVGGAQAPTDQQVHVEEWHLDIDKTQLRWESYVKAGYYGVLNRFFDPSKTSETPVPVDILVTGTVPAGSGLSSSAAMVVASTLAFLAVNNKLEGVTKGQLVEMAMENEKRVGVNSGGMDQAASVISTAGSALYITFYPKLAAELVPLPGSAKPQTDTPADTIDDAAKETKADVGVDKVTEGVAKLTTETPVVTTSTSDAADQAGVRASFVAEVPASSTDAGADKTTEDASKLTTETPVVTTSTSDAADQAGVRASFVAEVPASSSDTPASATDKSVPAEPAKPPKPAVFVIANSLVVSDKVVHAKTRYNLRVVETLAAARILARLMQVPVDRDPVHFAPNLSKERITLRELLGRWVGLGFEGEDTSEGLIVRETKGGREEVGPEGLMEGLREIREAVEFLRPKGAKDGEELGVPYEEMVKLSQLSEEEFKVVYPGIADVEASHFQLYKRTKHVYDEALRVLEFRDLCLQAAEGKGPSGEAILEALGALMNASQKSCAELFECSCPELDELTALCRASGAYGARLTGAGWGGCAVALVAEDEVESFIQKVKEGYAPYRELEGEALHEVIFATKPSSGACVYTLTE